MAAAIAELTSTAAASILRSRENWMLMVVAPSELEAAAGVFQGEEEQATQAEILQYAQRHACAGRPPQAAHSPNNRPSSFPRPTTPAISPSFPHLPQPPPRRRSPGRLRKNRRCRLAPATSWRSKWGSTLCMLAPPPASFPATRASHRAPACVPSASASRSALPGATLATACSVQRTIVCTDAGLRPLAIKRPNNTKVSFVNIDDGVVNHAAQPEL